MARASANSSQGFTGINFAAQLTKVAVDPSNPDRVAIAVQDVNLFISTDRGRSASMRQVPGSVFAELTAINDSLKASPRSSYGIAILPSGRIVLSIGTATVQGLISTDDGGASYRAILSAPAGDYNFIGCHPTVTGAVVAGARRSTDGGASFPTALGYVAQGLSAGGALYARSGNNVVMRASSWASGTPTWTEFYASPASIRKFGLNSHLMAVDPHDEFTVWTVDAAGDLIRVRNTGATAAGAQVTSLPLKSQAWGGPAADFGIADIARDPERAEPRLRDAVRQRAADDLARADRGRDGRLGGHHPQRAEVAGPLGQRAAGLGRRDRRRRRRRLDAVAAARLRRPRRRRGLERAARSGPPVLRPAF